MLNSCNIFQQARFDYNERLTDCKKHEKLTQEKVAELADTSLSTIKRIETDEAVPSPELVLRLSELYNCKKIVRVYCSNHCAIGTNANRNANYGFQPTSLFEAGYGLLNANKELDSFKNELFDILSDGKVSPDEVDRLKDILINLDKVQQIINTIKDMIHEYEHAQND